MGSPLSEAAHVPPRGVKSVLSLKGAVSGVPDLALTKRHVAGFTVGQNGTWTLVATNLGIGATTGATVVTDSLPAGASYVGAAGSGWNIVHSGGVVDLLDIIKRRLIISASGLARVSTAIICGAGIVVLYLGVRRRERIFAPLRGQPAFMAGIWGAFVATLAGALGNDSGPLMFEGGLWLLLFAAGYARSAPGALRPAPERAPKTAKDSGVAAGMVG